MYQEFTAPGPRHIRGPGRFLLWLVTSQPGRVAFGALLGSSWMVSLAAPPYLLGKAIDDGLVPSDPGALVGWVAAVFGAGVATAVLGIARHRTMTKIRMDASFRTIRAAIRHAAALGDTLRRRITTGEVVAVGVTDVRLAAQALTVTGPGVGAVVTYVVVAVILLSIAPLLALVVLIGVPVLALTLGPLLRRIVHVGANYRELQGTLTTRLVDILTGLSVLNGLGGKDSYASQYAHDSQALRERGYHLGAATSWVGAFAAGLPALFLAVVVWLAARMAAEGAITVGDLVAVYGYVAVLIVPVAFFIEGTGDIARGLVAARRVIRLLRLTPDHDDPTGIEPPRAPAVLRDPDSGVEIWPGLLTVLACERPADATTIVDRLGRFTGSATTWGDIRLDTIASDEVRRHLLVADNDAAIFTGSVRDVVSGRHAPDDHAISEAIHTAVASDVVDGLGDGLDSTIDTNGGNISGGQRQRLRLARAVYADPDVLLAVDPTSAVDSHTEATIASRLRTARDGKTTVITSTSPLVLSQADRVIYVAGGNALAADSHEELLDTAPGYQRLVSRDMDERQAS